MTYGQGLSVVTIPSEYAEMLTVPVPPARRVYRWFAIIASFLILWIAPVSGGNTMAIYAMLACVAICVWDAPACLFLIIASAGAYYDEGGKWESFQITPTEIAGLGLSIRCLISPGIRGITAFLGSLSGWVKGMVALYAVGIYGTMIIVGFPGESIPTLIGITTSLITFLIVGTLARKISNWRWIVIPLTMGLLLPAAYYLLIWGHLLQAVSTILQVRGGELRITAGRNDPNYVGSLIAPCFGVLLYLIISGKGLCSRVAMFCAACLCIAGCIETGSRAAFVVVLFGSLCAAVFAIKVRGLWAITGSVLLVLLVGGGIGFATQGLYSGQLLYVIERFSQETTRRVWGPALMFFLTHPIPDPAGYIQQYRLVAHQTFLTAGLDGGYLGLIGLSGAAIASIALSLRHSTCLSSKDRVWPLSIALAMILTAVSLCAISAPSHKVMWALFAICGLSAHLSMRPR